MEDRPGRYVRLVTENAIAGFLYLVVGVSASLLALDGLPADVSVTGWLVFAGLAACPIPALAMQLRRIAMPPHERLFAEDVTVLRRRPGWWMFEVPAGVLLIGAGVYVGGSYVALLPAPAVGTGIASLIGAAYVASAESRENVLLVASEDEPGEVVVIAPGR
jgi:hypothetical protein